MKKYQVHLVSMLAIVLVIMSCQKAHKSQEASDERAEYSEAVAEQNPENRLFRKKADFEFEVEDVFSSTKAIEKSVLQHSGYVTESNIENEILKDKQTILSEDSIKRWVKSYAHATIKARAPKSEMLGILQEIESQIALLNHRYLEAEEVTFEYQYQAEEEQMHAQNEADMDRVVKEGGKLNDRVEGVQKTAEIREQKRQARRDTKVLNDETKMVDFWVHIKGQEQMKTFTQVNFHDMEAAQSNFSYELQSALQSGWRMIQKIAIGVLYIWPFWLVLILGYFGYKNRKKWMGSLKGSNS